MKIADYVKKVILFIVILYLVYQPISTKVLAEGPNAELSLSVSQTVLNIGKTYTVILTINPNTNIDITTFDAVIGFDVTNLELIKADGKPESVPEGFDLTVSNIPDHEIVVLGEENKGGPISARGTTELLVMTFKVRDNAVVDSNAIFTISDECTVNIPGTGSNPPEPIFLSVDEPVSVKIGPRLDTNANLTSLVVQPGSLSPAFSKTVTAYNMNVSVSTSSIQVTATAEAATSEVDISGNENLKYGQNTLTVTVTAQDTDVKKVYTLTVIRAAPTATPKPTSPAVESVVSEVAVTMTPAEPSPTEMIASQTSENSEDESSDSTGSDEISESDPAEITGPEKEIQLWKQIALTFFVMFLIALCALLWFIIDKVSNRDKIVKIKRR